MENIIIISTIIVIVLLVVFLVFLLKKKDVNIFWNILRLIKRTQITQDIACIKEINNRATGNGKKIGIIEKGKVKDRFYKSRDKFREYVQFCDSKNIGLTVADEKILSSIYETEDILEPAKKLDMEIERASYEYNKAYKDVNNSGELLLQERQEAAKTIDQVQQFVNTIAKYPKEFDKDIKEITIHRTTFKEAIEFGKKQQRALKVSAERAGAGVATGAAVAGIAPTAAMWVATTFGTASTGTAISALSGAAATNAALAWLGGGAVAAGGTGMAAGQALLALAGPVGWGVAGGSILFSLLLFWRKKMSIQEGKKEEILRIRNCTTALKTLKADMDSVAIQTRELNSNLEEQFDSCNILRFKDYSSLTEEQKMKLGAIVNNTKSLAVLISKVLVPEEENDNSKRKKKS